MSATTGAWLLRDGTACKVDGVGRPMAHVKPLTVLLADDYAANRMLHRAQLEQLGYCADVVANGEEVLRAIHARAYDVILLDIRMPVMDGLETARRIRRRRAGAPPFIVAVTAVTLARDRERIAAAGIDAYIEKPVRQNELADVLAAAYEHKHRGQTTQDSLRPATANSVRLDLDPLHSRLGPAAAILLRHVIPAYLRELPGREARLQSALAAKDAAAVGRLLHGLKGASRAVGAAELAALCERLEQVVDAGRLPDGETIDALLAVARGTARALRRKLASLDA